MGEVKDAIAVLIFGAMGYYITRYAYRATVDFFNEYRHRKWDVVAMVVMCQMLLTYWVFGLACLFFVYWALFGFGR